MAGTTRLELATSAVTGQRSNQLNYVPTCQINVMRNRQCLCCFARFAYRAPVAPDCPKERESCPNRPRTASKPPPNFCISVHFYDFQNSPAQRAPGDPEFCQSGQNHQQNFRKSLSQKYPNSFSQNTKDHLHFPGPGMHEILKFGRNGDTSFLCEPLPATLVSYYPVSGRSTIARNSGPDSGPSNPSKFGQCYFPWCCLRNDTQNCNFRASWIDRGPPIW